MGLSLQDRVPWEALPMSKQVLITCWFLSVSPFDCYVGQQWHLTGCLFTFPFCSTPCHPYRVQTLDFRVLWLLTPGE